MTTPETIDRDKYALDGKVLSHSLVGEHFQYIESVKINVTGGSGRNTKTNIDVVGVDEGREVDKGNKHSLLNLDEISSCMLNEYGYQSSLGKFGLERYSIKKEEKKYFNIFTDTSKFYCIIVLLYYCIIVLLFIVLLF